SLLRHSLLNDPATSEIYTLSLHDALPISTLISINLVVVTIVFTLAAKLPPAVSAGLFLLTPLYFLTSLWGSARERASQHAMLIGDRKSTRLNSSHVKISYAVFCLKKKKRQ